MRILKIKGKNEAIIRQQIEKEYGPDSLVLSTHQERGQGLWGFMKKPQWVVTIAIEDEEACEKGAPNEMAQSMEDLKMQMEALRAELQLKQQPLEGREQERLEQPDKVDNVGPDEGVSQLFRTKLLAEGVHPEVIQSLLGKDAQETTIDEMVRLLYTRVVQSFQDVPKDEESEKVFFIGPTGVGKTTTIAKLTADKVLNHQKKVTLMTADTYRIAAIDQLRTYADILSVPIEIIYEEQDLGNYLEKWENQTDYIFIDTAGRSHKNVEQMIHMKSLLEMTEDKKVYLVLNMNTQFQDLKKIIASYELLTPDFDVIVTKSDETDVIGNLLNIAYCAKRPIAYLTIGQNVPDDFYLFDRHEYAKDLLGRMSYE